MQKIKKTLNEFNLYFIFESINIYFKLNTKVNNFN